MPPTDTCLRYHEGHRVVRPPGLCRKHGKNLSRSLVTGQFWNAMRRHMWDLLTSRTLARIERTHRFRSSSSTEMRFSFYLYISSRCSLLVAGLSTQVYLRASQAATDSICESEFRTTACPSRTVVLPYVPPPKDPVGPLFFTAPAQPTLGHFILRFLSPFVICSGIGASAGTPSRWNELKKGKCAYN